jgi:diaminohydroxyphosphoribosylaminopyrimidine deaminase/5-amino-6-(5-phosphoribosylamino)uracil reductase
MKRRNGIKKINEAGINVTVGLENECHELNKRFLLSSKERPYIILKWAESQDGFISSKSKIRTKTSLDHK